MTTANDKRTMSGEGFLLADAVITKVGDLPYTRKELGLGGNPSDTIMLSRPRAVLEQALPTLKGAPVTRGHPDKFVNSENFAQDIVGAVVTEPTIDQSGNVRAAVRLYDKDTIESVQRGDHQLSPGFHFVPEFITDNKGVIKQARFNHVAVLPNGRAGESVRILDRLPPEIHRKETSKMDDTKQMTDAIRLAVKDAMGEPAAKGLSTEQVESTLATAIDKALEPVIADITALKTKQAKDEADAKVKEAEDATNQKVEEAVKFERARMGIIADAKPFIDEQHYADLEGMDSEKVLRLAIGDMVEGTDGMDLKTLNGIFMGIKATRSAQDESVDPTASVVVRRSTKAQDMKRKKDMLDIADMRFKKARGMDMDKEEDM